MALSLALSLVLEPISETFECDVSHAGGLAFYLDCRSYYFY
ncbi:MULTISPECIES: hypothetical protein [Aminobacterium]|nr:hypothetical protein [Aminobacterium sp. UBA4908]